MSRESVLALLRERQGEYVSGEAMSRALGISRAGVWKAIEGLRQEGYTISSAPNRGYRLEDAPDKLRAGELSGPLAGALVGSKLMAWTWSTPPTPSASARLWPARRRGWW